MFDSKTRASSQLRGRAHTLGRSFSDLRVRPKLMVLHNLFFLVLAWAVYFSLMPLLESRVAEASSRELDLVRAVFAEGWTVRNPPLLPQRYDYREGPAGSLGVPAALTPRLLAHPGAALMDAASPDYLFRWDAPHGRLQRITVPNLAYDAVVERAKLILFVVLGAIYLIAILVLETIIMPQFVYRPLRLMLNADRATQAGDREHELINAGEILDDEIGQIMRSRNLTVVELRRQEDELARTLQEMEQLTTDLKNKNHLLETARQTLADQDRLVSLGLLSASVAHELNTPLAVLHGSIEKLVETVPERLSQERLQRMLRVTQRLRRISESLLDFARVRKQGMEPVDVHALVEEAWSLVGIDEKAGETTFLNQIPGGEQVYGNPDQLMQVFVNLLRNALCATTTQGKIIVNAEPAQLDGKPVVRIRVDDNGPGIPPDVLPNIFEAFVSTRLDSRGTGLGLTVSEGIITQHGGKISASNRPGGGASIEVLLPAIPSEVLT